MTKTSNAKTCLEEEEGVQTSAGAGRNAMATGRRIRTLRDVVDWGLCIGCGACAAACPRQAISLVNIPEEGIRPVIAPQACLDCECRDKVLEICPGYQVDAGLLAETPARKSEIEREIGPALEVWEGHAADPEPRHQGSSGAILTALALYCLEREGMEFVLHTGGRAEPPWLNETVRSRTRRELLERAGSRYAPASPCEGLGLVEQSPRPCVFIGKPCDAAAAAKLAKQRPELNKNLGLILTFFCAGTPSTQGTLKLLEALEAKPDEVDTLRYRGEGWPGSFKVVGKGGRWERDVSYEDSWDFLNRFRPFRCHLCPDGLGRVADLACGDAWSRYAGDGDPGRSIILVRTAKGREILAKAISAGYVTATPLEPREVLKAQHNLLERRRQLFGRLLAMKVLGVPTPRFKGFSLARSWLRLPLRLKLRTVLGTLRRVLTRGLWHRRSAEGGAGSAEKKEECSVEGGDE